MATSILLDEGVEIPLVQSLADFRQWAFSKSFPLTGRIDYLAGVIEVDMSPEDLYTHGKLKVRLVSALDQWIEQHDLGDLFSDRARVSHVGADLSAEPDLVFVSYASIEAQRVRLVPKASMADRYIEIEGTPDLVVEIVSDRSVVKDTQRLCAAYARAGVAEYWLADARGAEMVLQIHRLEAEGYELGGSDADGYQVSAILGARVRLERWRHHTGRWTYRLDLRP